METTLRNQIIDSMMQNDNRQKLTEVFAEKAIRDAWNNCTQDEKHRFYMAYAKNPQSAVNYLYESLKAQYSN